MKLKYNILIHTIILTLISISLFTIYTLANKNLDNIKSTSIYVLGMSLYGLFILFNFSIHKNSFYGVSSFCMTFLFSEKGFNNYDNISLLLNLFIFTILGFIIHIVRFKPKLYISHFSPTILFFVFCIALSGIGVNEYDHAYQVSHPWFMPFLVFGIGILLLSLLNYFECSNESTLEDVSIYFKGIITLIGYEIFFYMLVILGNNFQEFFEGKKLLLGIGSPNTVAIILELTIPFMLYFSFKRKYFINTLFFYIAYLLLILTLSRGAIIVTTFLMIPYTIYLFITHKNKYKIHLIYHISILSTIIISLLFLSIKEPKLISNYMNVFLAHFDTLTGRDQIWMYILEHWKINPVFGIGIVSNALWDYSGSGEFYFAHSTFLETLWMTGLVGFVGLLVHLFDKYFYIIKNKKYISLMLMFYLCAGIYGTFDVTYYNLHFTLFLLVIMYLYSSNIKLNKINYYNKFIV